MKVLITVFTSAVTLAMLSPIVSADQCSVDLSIPVDGCSNIGGNINKVSAKIGSNFETACNEHDRCYRTVGYTERECQTLFLSNMRGVCQATHSSGAVEIQSAILSCRPSILIPAEGLYDDWWSDKRDQGKAEVKRAINRVESEVGRIDDNLKRARDEAIYIAGDALDTVVDIAETIPLLESIIDIVGDPRQYFDCLVNATMEIGNSLPLGFIPKDIDEVSGVFNYPMCIATTEVMFAGVVLNNHISDNASVDGIENWFKYRQRNMYQRIKDYVQLQYTPGSTDCQMQARDTGVFREIATTADVALTARRMYELGLNRNPSSSEMEDVLQIAAADPANWQFEVIHTIEQNKVLTYDPDTTLDGDEVYLDDPAILSSINNRATPDFVDVGEVDYDIYNNSMHRYHSQEVKMARRLLYSGAALSAVY